jgi:uncharacterized protein
MNDSQQQAQPARRGSPVTFGVVPDSGRTYPPPRAPWVMHQRWNDLLFMHWPVAPEALRRAMPDALPPDTFEGQGWIGVVPFRMTNVRPRGTPALPWLSAFPELNVRTYVTLEGRPGIYFFSLDASNPVAVALARRFYSLPYMNARMRSIAEGDAIRYASRRTHRDAPLARFAARYWPSGPVFRAEPGTLASFLTDRYCLYTVDRHGYVLRGDIDHAPWPLQLAEAEMRRNTMAEPLGIRLTGAPLLHFARRVDMVAWWPVRVTG